MIYHNENPSQVVYHFVHAINTKNLERLAELMTDNHVFIDAHGQEVIGKKQMIAGWKGYFEWFPDYKIEITELFENDRTVVAFGYAGGSYRGTRNDHPENFWHVPAAWRIIVNGEQIDLWQVYADTKKAFDIIRDAE
jgi:ketosteroid isomerase-like protein